MLVFGKFGTNPKCITKESVSVILHHPSLNETRAKDYQSFDVPPGTNCCKEQQFSLTAQDRADGYSRAIWNQRTEMH